MHRIALLGMLLLTGCQHVHLRHNTINQAKTLSDLYEQQVLDNLARTVHDRHALPFFAYPKDGTTNISTTGRASASPLKRFEDVLGIDGSRTGLSQWGLTPLSDPDKLQLMQCAYQKAVYGAPQDGCVDCCEKEKAFQGKPDLTLKVYDFERGTALCDPKTGKDFDVRVGGTGETGLTYQQSATRLYDIKADGTVTIPQLDCSGQCGITCGWLSYGSRCDVPRDCCWSVGHHCGTYVWVKPFHRAHLSRLTLKILDYAVNDPAVTVARQKEVKLYVDKFGRITDSVDKRAGVVTAIIGINDPVRSALVTDQCALSEHAAAEQALKDQINALVGEINEDETLKKEYDEIRSSGIIYSLNPRVLSGELSPKVKRLYELMGQINDPDTDNLPPVEASPLVLPKQRSNDRSYYSVPSQYDIQRSQFGLGQ